MIETKEQYDAKHLKATRDKGLSERQELAISIAMEKWREMEASRNMNHLDERVRLREGIILCLHATRISEEEIQEEIACNGFSSLEPGEVVNMELYIEDGRGKAIDGIGSASGEKDVRYLVQMWGKSPKMDEYTAKQIIKRIVEGPLSGCTEEASKVPEDHISTTLDSDQDNKYEETR